MATPVPPAPKAYDITGRELSTAETAGIARAQMQQFGVPVILLDSARQSVAELTIPVSREDTARVVSVSFSDGAGNISTIPIFLPDPVGGGSL